MAQLTEQLNIWDQTTMHVCRANRLQGAVASATGAVKRTGWMWDEMLTLPWRQEHKHPSGCRSCQVMLCS